MFFTDTASIKKSKFILLIALLCLLLQGNAFAQAKFGENRTSIQLGSLMELESTNKGFLNVRLNTAQMNSVPVTASSKGMMIYNTDSTCLCVYNGSEWQNMCNGQKARQLKIVYTASAGDSTFLCPDIVFDENNIQIFRNGVQINFSATVGTKIVKLEMDAFCKKDDEIKIVQLVTP
ncbi:MAG: hypothetical protein QM530_00730 [Phycisphaerales bacterium]|nr:hypothetical protein [Phycisphaerales bacterium]